MGAYLSKPVTEKETESGSGSGMKWAATSMQGWRVNQEVGRTDGNKTWAPGEILIKFVEEE